MNFKEVQSSHRRWLRQHAKEVKGTHFYWHSQAHSLGISATLCSASQTVDGRVRYSLWLANMANFTMAKINEYDSRLDCDKAAKLFVEDRLL